MAVVGGNARESPGLGLRVPLGKVVSRIFHLRGEQLVGVEPQVLLKFLEPRGA